MKNGGSFSRPDAGLHIDESEYPENALATLGIKPDDVDYVFVTPFQMYSVGNINMFKNAQICLSKKGWISLMAPKWKKPSARPAGRLHT